MALLALDLLVMGGAAYIVWDRIEKKQQIPDEIAAPRVEEYPTQASAPISEPAVSTTATVISSSAPAPAADAGVSDPKAPPRKIHFRYSDIAAKRVSIVGDFNQWSPKLMKKDAYGHWTLTLSLRPGQYAYNFIVDGRMIRDPSNKRVKQSAQKIPSSLLDVAKVKR